MYSDTNVDLVIKVTISATNVTPERAAQIVASAGPGLVAPDVDSSRKVTSTAAWIDDEEPTSTERQIAALLGKKTVQPDTADDREVTSAQAMDEAAPYVAPYIANPVMIAQIGEYLGSRASDEALVVVIADTYHEASLVVDAIEADSRLNANHGDIERSVRINGDRSVRYENGARVRPVAARSSRYSADMVVVVPNVHAQAAYMNAAVMTNGKPNGSVRRLINKIPGVAGMQQDGATS